MGLGLGMVGAGQFAGQFAKLFQAQPGVTSVYVTGVIGQRAADRGRGARLRTSAGRATICSRPRRGA
jgi:hypothetical protein